MKMKNIWLLIALWNTLVAAINLIVLPCFIAPTAMIYMTPMSQTIPILIPFAFYLLTSDRRVLVRALR